MHATAAPAADRWDGVRSRARPLCSRLPKVSTAAIAWVAYVFLRLDRKPALLFQPSDAAPAQALAYRADQGRP